MIITEKKLTKNARNSPHTTGNYCIKCAFKNLFFYIHFYMSFHSTEEAVTCPAAS